MQSISLRTLCLYEGRALGFVNLLWYNRGMEEHTHHGWQTDEVKMPTTDELFTKIWKEARERKASVLNAIAGLNIWQGKLNEAVAKAPFDRHEIMDAIGTEMCGLIILAQAFDINPHSCLAYANKPEDFEPPKTYKTLNPLAPKPLEEPQWMKSLRWELQVRFVGLFIYYPDEQCWVRLEEVEIDLRNTPEGRKMDRVKDYYGNTHFVTDLIEAESNRQIKAYNECPSDKLVY